MSMVSGTPSSCGVACPPGSAGVGAAFMSPIMMVWAGRAISRYTSATAWTKGSVVLPTGMWVLMTFSCHPSPTTS